MCVRGGGRGGQVTSVMRAVVWQEKNLLVSTLYEMIIVSRPPPAS